MYLDNGKRNLKLLNFKIYLLKALSGKELTSVAYYSMGSYRHNIKSSQKSQHSTFLIYTNEIQKLTNFIFVLTN